MKKVFVAALCAATVVAASASAEYGKKEGSSGRESTSRSGQTSEQVAIDANRDQRVSRDEFIRHEEDLFARADANKDGRLDSSEYSNLHSMQQQDQTMEGSRMMGQLGQSDKAERGSSQQRSRDTQSGKPSVGTSR